VLFRRLAALAGAELVSAKHLAQHRFKKNDTVFKLLNALSLGGFLLIRELRARVLRVFQTHRLR